MAYHAGVKSSAYRDRVRRLKHAVIWIVTHYTGGFIIVMSLSVISCALSVAYLSTLEKALVRTFEFEIKGQDYSQKAYTLMLSLENEVKDLIIFSDQARKAQTMGEINQNIAELRATLQAADTRFYTRAGREILKQSQASLKGFIASLQQLAKRLMNDDSAGGNSLRDLQVKRTALEKDLKHLIANKTANSNVGYSELIGQLRLSLLITIGILLISIAIRVLMYISGRKKQPIKIEAN